MSLRRYINWSHDQERQPGGMQNTLSNAAQRPVLQPTIAMRCHRDDVAATERSCSFRIFTVLCHSNNASSDIVIDGDRPGDREMKVSTIIRDKSFADFLYSSAQVLSGLLQDSFALVMSQLLDPRHDHHLREMERTVPGSCQRRDQMRCGCDCCFSVSRAIQWNKCS